MAGDWIKARHDLIDDPDVLQMSDILDIEVPTVVGHLLAFWIWMDRHTTDGKQIKLTEAMIDRKIGLANFAKTLREVHWLSGENGCLELPNYERHNGNTAKARALEAEAKRLRRVNNNVGHVSDKTESKCPTREEKRREEYKVICREVISYLNEKANKNFKTTESQIKFISSRLEEGYTLDDLKKVVDAKCKEWLNTDHDKYLRPETLFNATKFNSYHGNLGKTHDPAKGAK